MLSTAIIKIDQTWEVLPLGEVVDILDSKRVPINSEERAKRIGNIPYYGATGQVGWIDDYLFDEELLLLGEDGAPFLDNNKPKAYLISGKSWVNNHAHVLKAKNGLLNKFLLYQLNNLDYRPYISGTTRYKLPQGTMRQIPIIITSIEEQQRIVAEIEKQFTRLDAGVAALKRVQANLKRYRASVLKAACEGKLVPTEAELARKEGRDYEPASVLMERILKEGREKWMAQNPGKKYVEPKGPDVSNLPELPEGWSYTDFQQINDGSYNALKAGPFGSSLKKSFYVQKGYKIYGQEQVIRGDAYWGEYFISEEKFKSLESCAVKPNDILISLVGTTGKVLILPDDIVPGIINPRLIKISINKELINLKYIKQVLESLKTRTFFKLFSHGGTMEIINLSIVKLLPIPLPPLHEQKRIVNEVEKHISVIDELEKILLTSIIKSYRVKQAVLQRHL